MRPSFLRLLSAATFLLIFIGATDSIYGQAWTSANGKFEVEAEFIQLKDGKVELKRDGNGKVIKVALKDLSKESQKRARQLQKEIDQKAKPEKKTGTSELLEQLELKCEAGWEETSNFGSGETEPTPVVVKITATGEAAGSAIQYGKLKLKSFTDGDGKTLEQDEDQFAMDDIKKSMLKIDRETGFFSSHPENGVSFEIKIPTEAQPEVIGELSGSFSLLTGGKRTTESFENLSKHYGKVLKSVALRKSGLKVKVEKPEMEDGSFGLSFTVTGKMKMMNRLYVGDSSEEQFEIQNGSATSTYNNQTTYTFFFPEDVSDEAILFVEMVEGAFELNVPFSFRDIEVLESE